MPKQRQPKPDRKKRQKTSPAPKLRVGQYVVKRVGSDQYAGRITEIRENGRLIVVDGFAYCRVNRPGLKHVRDGGFGELTGPMGTYREKAKYRHLCTWFPVEGVARTVLDPGF